jgi:alpha-galactosidase
VLWADNEWLAEGRWQQRSLRDVLPDLNRPANDANPRGMFGLNSVGTWSAGNYLPMGAMVSRSNGRCSACRSSTTGPGTGSSGSTARGAVYLALVGPTDTEHDWHLTLAPDETFSTVPGHELADCHLRAGMAPGQPDRRRASGRRDTGQ